jgi:hypothetical protein
MRFCSTLGIALGLAAVFSIGAVRASEEKTELKDVPKSVIDAVKKRFPKGELTEASKEVTDGKTVYEVSVKKDGKNTDVTLTPDGAITMIEKEIADKELPKAVNEGVKKKYPKAKYKLAEEVTVVQDGKEKLSYYEVLVAVGDDKQIEIVVAIDGTIKKEEDKSADKDDEKDEKKGEKKDEKKAEKKSEKKPK